jgi:circadian clock protein KaiC
MNEPGMDPAIAPLTKLPTGIDGFDALTNGGLPCHRLTAVVGGAGSGKTVFTLQTLADVLAREAGAVIFVAFEEAPERILANAAAFDWAAALLDPDRLRLIDARFSAETIVSGAFELSGLMAGLTALKDEIGARFVVFDAIDMLLTGLKDEWLERQELLRLNEWIQQSQMTAILTSKAFIGGERDQRRSELIQYMADCVVVLSRTVTATESSRTLCVEKYRGADFAANPAPIVISSAGLEVIAMQTSRVNYPTFEDRVSSGVPRLDLVLTGGYRRGGSVLISGSPGTSKTSLAVSFAVSACQRGETALFISFDESGAQIVENVRSFGLDLTPHIEDGRLRMASFVSNGRSPEEHFLQIRRVMREHAPTCLVIDPISSLLKSGYPFSRQISEAILDVAKSMGVTVVCTSLLDHVSGDIEMSASNVSTISDTWIHVSYIARDGERNRAITIIKSRGTAHSNQVRELVIGSSGIDLVDVYVAEGEVLMGSSRAQKEADMARRQALHEMETRLRRMTFDAEIAELEQRAQAVALALQAKRREAEFMELASERRDQELRDAVARRIDLRRAMDEIGSSGPTSASRASPEALVP